VDLIDVLCGLGVAAGLVGVLVPVLPGSALVWLAVLAWAFAQGGAGAWGAFVAVTVLLGAGAVVKYVVPARRLDAAGVPRSTLLVGGLAGVVGFFVVPLLGLPLGFVAGVHVAEMRRVGSRAARFSTRHALAAAGLSLLVELSAALLAAGTWLVAALAL